MMNLTKADYEDDVREEKKFNWKTVVMVYFFACGVLFNFGLGVFIFLLFYFE